MRTVPAALKTHLQGAVTTVATCWLIQRRDGTFLRYTDHDADIFVSTQGTPVNGTYRAAVGYTGSSIASGSDGSVDNLEVAAILAADSITEADLLAGLYDYAEVKLFLLNWAAPADGILKLRRGRLGEVSIRAGQFTAELRGLAQALQQTIGETYSPACRADLGDTRCKVDLGPFTVTGTVTVSANPAQFTAGALNGLYAANWFRYGLLTWTGGANNTRRMEVKTYGAAGTFALSQPMPQAIAVGDTFSVYAGCDKKFATCQTKFNNVVNFRGEPHLPGNDEMLRGPDAG